MVALEFITGVMCKQYDRYSLIEKLSKKSHDFDCYYNSYDE